MKDFLLFKKMITPVFVQVFFWVGIVAIVVISLLIIFNGSGASYSPYGSVPAWFGFVYLLLAPIIWRVACEGIILIFQIFESLHRIEQKLDKPQ